jgi:hypothetical protein
MQSGYLKIRQSSKWMAARVIFNEGNSATLLWMSAWLLTTYFKQRQRKAKSSVKSQIVTNHCGLSSVAKPDTIRSELFSCLEKRIRDLRMWQVKQSTTQTELSCDTPLKIKFEALSLSEFWIFIQKRTLGTLSTGHRGVFFFLERYICVGKKYFQ